jgi:hypothetical protein
MIILVKLTWWKYDTASAPIATVVACQNEPFGLASQSLQRSGKDQQFLISQLAVGAIR